MSLCLVGFVFLVAGCSNNTHSKKSTSHNQVLSGVYRTPSTDDDGNEQPDYWYFKKDGTLMYCTPETGNDDNGYYGGAMRGTWKSLGNNRFQIKMHSIYDNDYFVLKGKLVGNKFKTFASAKNAKYSWTADTSTKIDMTYEDFMSMFNKAKKSQEQKVQENGYDKPDNDSSTNSTSTNESSQSSSSSSSNMSFEERTQLPENDPNYLPKSHDNFEGYTDGPNGLVKTN